MTDETLVINSTDSLTPAEQAAKAYLDQRKLSPLPTRWTQTFDLVAATHGRADYNLAPLDPNGPAQQTVITCYLEDHEYAVELLFLDYRPESARPSDQPPTGGFRLEFYRKDRAAPTHLETVGMIRLFGGGPFGVSSQFAGTQVIDGDTEDRPLPSTNLFDAEDHPDKPQTRVIHFGLLDTPHKPTDGSLQVVRNLTVPTVRKNNTRMAFKLDLRRTLMRRLRTLLVVHDWLIACRTVGDPPDVVAEPEREEAREMAKALERRYGTGRLELLAGIPATGSCPADEWASRITHAIARAWGQIRATKQLLRRVTSERY